MTSTQPSKLLSNLFENIDEDARLTVLHIGPALPETVDFFSHFRCKLHFLDLFSELPIEAEEDVPLSLDKQFAELMQFPPGTHFDICLFWDIFNYLGADAISSFLLTLRPYLRTDSMAHGFAVHNLRSSPVDQVYGISEPQVLTLRSRAAPLRGYAPHPQSRMKTLLSCFDIGRTVLLADSRLEMVLNAKL
ncbi:MAG: hypothetical protein ABJK20_17785 [Halieaceae bacterium]